MKPYLHRVHLLPTFQVLETTYEPSNGICVLYYITQHIFLGIGLKGKASSKEKNI